MLYIEEFCLYIFLFCIFLSLIHIYFNIYLCITESQEEKSAMNGDGGFIINLSKDQKNQYGSQFGDDQSEAPNIGNLQKLNKNPQNRLP